MAEVCKVIPTGIASLDALVGGGFPSGSLVLLVGEVGSGYQEFVATSLAMLGAMKSGKLSKPEGAGVELPRELWWISFIRSSEDLLREVSVFDRELYESFKEQVKLKDFSTSYFATSSVPLEWISDEAAEKGKAEALGSLSNALAGVHRAAERPALKPKGILTSLAEFLSAHGERSLVAIHSLTDLARLYSDSEERWYEFVMFLRGLRRAVKKWDGMIYMDLVTNLLERRREEELVACADGVLNFAWEQTGTLGRKRMLFIREFRSLISCFPEVATRFEVNVSPSTGFYVVKPEVIEGLKRM